MTWFETVHAWADRSSFKLVDVFIHFLTGKAQQWASGLYKEARALGKVVTYEQLRDEFKRTYGEGYKNDADEARAKLFTGKVSQKADESVSDYTSRFRAVLRDTQGMREKDAIWWYKFGLQSALRKKCDTMPASGKDWEQLEDLIQYAIAEEGRDKRYASMQGRDAHLAYAQVAKGRQNFRSKAPSRFSGAQGSRERGHLGARGGVRKPQYQTNRQAQGPRGPIDNYKCKWRCGASFGNQKDACWEHQDHKCKLRPAGEPPHRGK